MNDLLDKKYGLNEIKIQNEFSYDKILRVYIDIKLRFKMCLYDRL